MTTAVIYARYSSSSQREESIAGQLRECRQYAERHDMTVIHEYTDSALTGTTDKRPSFQQMISDSETKSFHFTNIKRTLADTGDVLLSVPMT